MSRLTQKPIRLPTDEPMTEDEEMMDQITWSVMWMRQPELRRVLYLVQLRLKALEYKSAYRKRVRQKKNQLKAQQEREQDDD